MGIDLIFKLFEGKFDNNLDPYKNLYFYMDQGNGLENLDFPASVRWAEACFD
jgi:hypothetical protein